MRRVFLYPQSVYGLLRLAVPLALTGLAQAVIFFFETLFLAHLGADVLAAGALVSGLFGTLIVVLYGIFSAINVLVAYQYGRKDYASMALVLRDGLWLALFLSVPTFFLCWHTAPIFLAFHQSPALVLLATAYFHALAWGVLPDFLLMVFLEFIMGLGYARTILVFTLLSVPMTLFFSGVFIFGVFGMPALGIAGAGWGMSISYWLSFGAFMSYVLINKNYRYYWPVVFSYRSPAYFGELLRVGLPIGVMYATEVAFFFVLTLVMGSMDRHLLVANQITLQYFNVVMTIIFSLSQAMTVRMGHLLGAKDLLAAVCVKEAGLLLAVFLMGLVAISYLCFSDQLIQLDFNIHDPGNQPIVRYAKQLLGLCAFFQILEALRLTLLGALRSLKDTHFPLAIAVLSYWFIALPVGYLLAMRSALGGIGLWWGMLVGVSVAVPLLYWRFESLMQSYAARLLAA